MLQIEDDGRVRLITLNRPEALNALSSELVDSLEKALYDAAKDSGVAVVVLTGTGRAYCVGADVKEAAARTMDVAQSPATPIAHGFEKLLDRLTSFPKLLICAVNGLAIGLGATMLGYADLVLMSRTARIRCPFTDLGLMPEAGSSFTFVQRIGPQAATWLLLSSEWADAEECERMGLAWRLCPPDDLLTETMAVARHLAAKPIAAIVEGKRTLAAANRTGIAAARAREDVAYRRLQGTPAKGEAFTALFDKRTPDFVTVDNAYPPDLLLHALD